MFRHRVGGPGGSIVREDRVLAKILGQSIGGDLNAHFRGVQKCKLLAGIGKLSSCLVQFGIALSELRVKLTRTQSNQAPEH